MAEIAWSAFSVFSFFVVIWLTLKDINTRSTKTAAVRFRVDKLLISV